LQRADHGVFIAQSAQPPGAVGILRRFDRKKNKVNGARNDAGIGEYRTGHHNFTLIMTQAQFRMRGAPTQQRRAARFMQHRGDGGPNRTGSCQRNGWIVRHGSLPFC